MLIYGVMVHLLYVRVGAVVVVVVLLWEISLHRVACISMCDRDRGYYLQSFDNYPPRLEVKEERGRESFFSLSDNPHSSPARRNRLSLNAAPPHPHHSPFFTFTCKSHSFKQDLWVDTVGLLRQEAL